MHIIEKADAFNEVFQANGLSPYLQLGSNTPGAHPASIERPAQNKEWDIPSPRGYRVSKHLVNEPLDKPFKIIIAGAGAAGIDFLHHAPSALEGLGVEIACYDKNPEVGGTWYENRYPGCACDVPSVGYTFPWRPNPNWTQFYSGAAEIWQYFKEIVDQEGMMKYIQLNTKVIGAAWDEGKSQWTIKLSKQTILEDDDDSRLEWEEKCDLFINGMGFLKYVH